MYSVHTTISTDPIRRGACCKMNKLKQLLKRCTKEDTQEGIESWMTTQLYKNNANYPISLNFVQTLFIGSSLDQKLRYNSDSIRCRHHRKCTACWWESYPDNKFARTKSFFVITKKFFARTIFFCPNKRERARDIYFNVRIRYKTWLIELFTNKTSKADISDAHFCVFKLAAVYTKGGKQWTELMNML